MSETQSATSEPAQTTTQATQQPRPSLRARLEEKASSIFGPPKDEQTGAQPAQVAEQAAQAIEAKGGEVPEQKPGETDHNYSLRLASTLRRLQQAEHEALTHRKGRETAEGKLKELEAILEGARKDPIRALELAGMTPDKLAEAIVEGKIRPAEPTAKLPPEVQSEIQELREAAKRLREKEEAEAKAASRRADLELVASTLKNSAEEYPLLASMPNAAERVLEDLYTELERTGKQPDIGQAFASMQSAILNDAAGLLSNDRVVKLLLERNGQLRDTLTKALGMAPREQPSVSPTSNDQGTRPVDGPRALSANVVSEVPGYQKRTFSERETKSRLLKAADGIFGT